MQVKRVCSGARENNKPLACPSEAVSENGFIEEPLTKCDTGLHTILWFRLPPTPRYDPLLGVVLATKPDFNITTWCLVIRIHRDYRVFVRMKRVDPLLQSICAHAGRANHL